MIQELKPGASSAPTSAEANRPDPSPPAATKRRTYAEIMDQAEENFARWCREQVAADERKRKGLPSTEA
jgi:hypothetical protein